MTKWNKTTALDTTNTTKPTNSNKLTINYTKGYLAQFCHSQNSFPSQSQTFKKSKLIFYFHFSLWCLKRFYESLKGLHKTFSGTTKCENKNLP